MSWIFIHNPKTAGWSIKKTLRNLVVFDPEQPHLKPSDWEVRDPTLWAASQKFMFCRNPYDRLVSAYHTMFYAPHMDADPTWHDIKLELQVMGNIQNFINDWDTFAYKDDFRLQLQKNWAVDSGGSPCMDFIGRFEDIDAQVNLFRTEYLLIPAMTNPLPYHDNVSPHDPWQTYYQYQAAIDFANAIYAEDFTFFSYTMVSTVAEMNSTYPQ